MGCCGSKAINVEDVPLKEIKSTEDVVTEYITTDCEYRKSKGSEINTETQIRLQRIEIICMGCFECRNKESIQNETIKILFRDNAIANTKYRPDLIFMRKGKLYHVEIDENSHSGYDRQKEAERHNLIRNYCISNYGSYNLIRFNPHCYGKLDTLNDKLNIAEQFNHLLLGIDGLLMYERTTTKNK